MNRDRAAKWCIYFLFAFGIFTMGTLRKTVRPVESVSKSIGVRLFGTRPGIGVVSPLSSSVYGCNPTPSSSRRRVHFRIPPFGSGGSMGALTRTPSVLRTSSWVRLFDRSGVAAPSITLTRYGGPFSLANSSWALTMSRLASSASVLSPCVSFWSCAVSLRALSASSCASPASWFECAAWAFRSAIVPLKYSFVPISAASDMANPAMRMRLDIRPSLTRCGSRHSANTSPTTPINTSVSPTYSNISHKSFMRTSAKIQICGWLMIAIIALVRATVLLIRRPKNVP